ncbi:MAG: class I SAM-dependent methyltransferase [Ignavibacteriae bacterium]|nr:class I SAM-dependent methyltransferase [Ignavibacteriota bacterium]
MRKPVVPFDAADSTLLNVFDDLPLWSAPFGLKLLDQVKLKGRMNVLDIGFGSGFPLLELAQRLGDSCRVFGIDPWTAGIQRARTKADQMQVENVEVIEGVAEQMPFADEFFDLIVSNNGINNVSDQSKAVAECARISKRGGQFLLTVNLPGTMREFYNVYEETLASTGRLEEVRRLNEHIAAKRKPTSFMMELLTKHGFAIVKATEDSFTMRFLDGSALLNHFFLRLAFVEPWQQILAAEDVPIIFDRLEENLNTLARQQGELRLTIPFVCIDSTRTY